MSYKTLEVELVNGQVLPCGAEALPTNGRGLLTLLDSGVAPAPTCGELNDRWPHFEKLPADDANDFADDLEQSRASLPPLKSAWD